MRVLYNVEAGRRTRTRVKATPRKDCPGAWRWDADLFRWCWWVKLVPTGRRK